MIDTQAYIKFTDLISELDKEQLKELVSIDGNLSNSQLSDRICNLIDILNEVSE